LEAALWITTSKNTACASKLAGTSDNKDPTDANKS
jgi:hypothetical protein